MYGQRYQLIFVKLCYQTCQNAWDIVFQEFCLEHYAGPVTYDVNGFLDKNSDLLFRDLKEVSSSVSVYLYQHAL